MITQEILQNRINNFFGYGSMEAPVWFVGMDERFDSSEGLEMLEEQFRYTEANMLGGMLDASRSKINEWNHLANMGPFLPESELQTTWKYPIALYLYLQSGISLTTDERGRVIKEYQRNILADAEKKETATLELSPLPCPSTKKEDWLYGNSDLVGLSSRREYEREYLQERTRKIKEFIQVHKPKLIIFYSMGYLPYWTNIIGEMPEETTRRTRFASNKDTAFCVIPNGGQSGLSYNELYEYADKIKEKVNLI
ncbi:hypothetical protein HY416_01310 [Candidatus Kaiserbacteria bacterium]|nr:hypothetical protein [Candidatus Kaiserbacteria bacterium]